MPKIEAIGFPPPLLGPEPQRLPILAKGADWLALDKPVGCLIDAHPWNQDAPSMVAGLRTQVEAGKPELEPYGIQTPYATHYLDVEATGIALLAANKEARGRLRDAIGSSQARFTFLFVARQAPIEETLSCTLPIGEDTQVPRAAIERKLGKKSLTHFRRLATAGVVTLWEATMDFPRPQQVRVHAIACGFSICGESLFEASSELRAGELKTQIRGTGSQRVVYPGLCLRLTQLELQDGNATIQIAALPTKAWRAVLRAFEIEA